MRKEARLFKLTEAQKRIWHTQLLYPDSAMFNIGGTVRIKGVVQIDLLKQAIEQFVRSHTAFQIRIQEIDEGFMQYFDSVTYRTVDVIDFSKQYDSEEDFKLWSLEQATTSFDFFEMPLYYFCIFKISDNDFGYFIKIHHIIADGWSIQLLTEQITSGYLHLLEDDKTVTIERSDYQDFLNTEQEYIKSKKYQRDSAFWNQSFVNLEEAEFSLSHSLEIKGKRKTFILEKEYRMIKNYCTQHHISENIFFTTLYFIYLYKTTGKKDITIGTPVLGRLNRNERTIFGMFVNSLPFRMSIEGHESILDLMKKVYKQLGECYKHQKFPYNHLIAQLPALRQQSGSLYNSCVNFYNTKMPSQIAEMHIENSEFYNGEQEYDLQMIIRDWSGGDYIQIDFDYKTSLFTEDQIKILFCHLKRLIYLVLESPDKILLNICLLNSEESQKLLIDYNQTNTFDTAGMSLIDQFRQQVKLVPDHIAIRCLDSYITYQQLEEQSNRLAACLCERGVQPETIVGLLACHSIETIVGILGIMKARGAYLPLDQSYPTERILFMLRDSECQFLLHYGELSHDFDFSGTTIDLSKEDNDGGVFSSINEKNKEHDLAYLIYTSGSTGKPKGIMIEHRNLLNYINMARRTYIRDNQEKFAVYSSLSFDLTITSIFTPLVSGCQMIIYQSSSDEDEHVLHRIIKDNEVTIIKLTPSHLMLLEYLNIKHSSIKRLIVGGENLTTALAGNIHQLFDGNIEIFNEYGPSETTVGCMIYTYNSMCDTSGSVPIGKPIDNTQIYLLDEGQNPVPIGTIGEIYISGDSVGRGYYNRSELTQEKFLNNPFISGQRMYRSGDLGKFINSSIIEFITRKDNQIKIRGYRIELGEIERQLLQHENVKQAVVHTIHNKTGSTDLAAFVVVDQNITIAKLKQFLLQYLPFYMIPNHLMILDYIPLTVNGKIDLKSLPEIKPDKFDPVKLKVACTEAEQQLLVILSDVLYTDDIKMDDDFFYLGGDSIKAIQISSRLGERGYGLKANDILRHPIIGEMSAYLEIKDVFKSRQKPCQGTIPFTPILLWFFEQNFFHVSHYNQSVFIKLDVSLSNNIIVDCVNYLVHHHDSFRINYDSKQNRLFYNQQLLNKKIVLKEYDLTDKSEDEQQNELREISQKLKSRLNIEKELLLKACILNYGYQKKLMITAHHLAVDGVSWRIIGADIQRMISQLSDGKRIDFPLKTSSYQDWSNLLCHVKSNIIAEIPYWQRILEQTFQLKTDHNVGLDTVSSSRTIVRTLNKKTIQKLLSQCNQAYHTKTEDLLLVALMIVLKNTSNTKSVLIDLETYGREYGNDDIDLSRTVGWFTSIFPFYVEMENSIAQNIIKVKEELRKVPEQGQNFGIIKYLTKTLVDKQQRQVRFNFLGDLSMDLPEDSAIQLFPDFTGYDQSPQNKLTCQIDINSYIDSEGLTVMIRYGEHTFTELTMENFITAYMSQIQQVIDHTLQQQCITFTPSDFDTIDLSQEELDFIFGCKRGEVL